MLFYSNNGCTNAPQCYVIRTLSLHEPASVLRHTYIVWIVHHAAVPIILQFSPSFIQILPAVPRKL